MFAKQKDFLNSIFALRHFMDSRSAAFSHSLKPREVSRVPKTSFWANVCSLFPRNCFLKRFRNRVDDLRIVCQNAHFGKFLITLSSHCSLYYCYRIQKKNRCNKFLMTQLVISFPPIKQHLPEHGSGHWIWILKFLHSHVQKSIVKIFHFHFFITKG